MSPKKKIPDAPTRPGNGKRNETETDGGSRNHIPEIRRYQCLNCGFHCRCSHPGRSERTRKKNPSDRATPLPGMQTHRLNSRLVIVREIMASVFFSYSHVDESLRDQLEKCLAMLKNQGTIDTWHDRRILPGDELDGSISKAIESADLILLLVSPDFLASKYCYDVEMTRALERHEAGEARVVPIILRPCDWRESPLSKLLAAPKDGKPVTKWPDLDEAFQDVVSAIRKALPKQQNAPVLRSTTDGLMQTLLQQAQPRSSNLRLSKQFTEADRDRFLRQTFEYLADFFEGSLAELAARNEGIEVYFKRVDANRFTVVIYRDGKARARCKIGLGGMMGSGIYYTNNDQAPDSTMNDGLSVVDDDQGLYLNPIMGSARFGSSGKQHLTMEGGAEYFWEMLIAPLQ